MRCGVFRVNAPAYPPVRILGLCFNPSANPGESNMKILLAILAVATLSACGVETATTAATSAEMKKREMEQAKKTVEQAKQKIEQSTQQMMERAAQAEEKSRE
jgi:outer membrane biogenesis lipoprotein LolB